jgi:hypothetical protein
MGAMLGGSYGSTNSQSTSSSNANTANTYAPGQTGLQSQLGTSLSQNLAASDSGTLTPGTTAMQTSAADQINKTSSGLTDRVNQFLAQRRFGKSGQTGTATLQGELGRESQLGTSAATFAGQQQTLNSTNLLAALNYAFSSLGTTQAATGATQGSGSGWGISGGVGVGKTS